MNHSIDINCDLGESFGNFKIGNDDAVFPYLSSCNIACGFHGGDPLHMKNTIAKAIKHNVQIGAHPSYPDRLGFGRNKMNIDGKELQAIIEYQVAVLKAMVESQGAQINYVKPHGALYNSMSNDLDEAKYVIAGVLAIDPKLKIMGIAGSTLEAYAITQNIDFIPEGFADRRYEEDGNLRSRRKEGAVIHSAIDASAQVLSLAKDHKLIAFNGKEINIKAKSICIHGDNPAAPDILRAIHQQLSAHNIKIKHF